METDGDDMMVSLITRIAVATVAMIVFSPVISAKAEGLDDMVGCWLADSFTPVSVVTDPSDPGSARVINTKALLLFNRIRNSQYLVFGSIFEWNRERTAINGPVFQNGAYEPSTGRLTFGHPGGGLDTAKLEDENRLLYIHTRSGPKSSSMSVREMRRIDCDDARRLSKALEESKSAR